VLQKLDMLESKRRSTLIERKKYSANNTPHSRERCMLIARTELERRLVEEAFFAVVAAEHRLLSLFLSLDPEGPHDTRAARDRSTYRSRRRLPTPRLRTILDDDAPAVDGATRTSRRASSAPTSTLCPRAERVRGRPLEPCAPSSEPLAGEVDHAAH
jgi:hypothetical protein